MPRVLFIDTSPFAGGAQASFRTIINSVSLEGKALAVGAGLWDWARHSPWTSLQLSTSHWRARLSGLLQYHKECRQNGPKLLDFVENIKPDIIHCNTVRSALLLCGLPQLKQPVIIHDRDLKMPWLARYYASRKLSPLILAVSSSVSQKWHGILPESRCHTLANGFDLEGIAKTPPIRQPDPNSIILAAEFEPWKNHALFLAAFRLAQRKHPNLRAIIKGRMRPHQEDYLLWLQAIIKNEAIPNVELIVDDSPALPWIAASQLLVTCSSQEPFGRTAIEALALGKRVVATHESLATELFTLDGITSCEATPAALAETILDALTAPKPSPDLTPFSCQTLAHNLAEIYARI